MSFERTAQCCPLFGMCDFEEMFMKIFNPNLVVYCSPAEGGETIRKNSHFVSSAIHIKIGRILKNTCVIE